MKFIIDEDLSPRVARYLCQEFCFDAIAVRDRGLLGATDPEVLEYALRYYFDTGGRFISDRAN
jgi:predicted nuclease of predicted toxin-antitoxin system